jgi:mono/diheme cytochrome c family protein
MGLMLLGGDLQGQQPGAVPAAAAAPVSYYKEVRPILQQHCNGCHQPAKPMGGYRTTSYADLFQRGERDKPGVVPGRPDQSYLVEQIRIHSNGKAEMPKGRDPLTPAQIDKITTWIAQGAKDDTPPAARTEIIDADHPPHYNSPPVITSLAFSPDGQFLAVTGYHEILLYDTQNWQLRARLIGISERIQSLAFSPQGDKLAAVGGAPGRFGEVQVWDYRKAKLLLSAPYTFDTLYGVSWSPDGRLIAFGCADNNMRVIDALSGKQVLQMGTHTDWVLGTAFSQDGEHVVSVSRDMSMRLTEVATQRFIDSVTSITPGALKGGLMAVDRRPWPKTVTVRFFSRTLEVPRPPRYQKVPPDTPGVPPKLYDEVVAAGADGTPRLYKIHREQKREIGDDANKIREYEPMPGRISAVAFHPQGYLFAAASSLDGTGQVRIYDVRQSVRKILCEQVSGPAYAVAWHPDGRRLASGGFDGIVWIHDANSGKLLHKFIALPTQPH